MAPLTLGPGRMPDPRAPGNVPIGRSVPLGTAVRVRALVTAVRVRALVTVARVRALATDEKLATIVQVSPAPGRKKRANAPRGGALSVPVDRVPVIRVPPDLGPVDPRPPVRIGPGKIAGHLAGMPVQGVRRLVTANAEETGHRSGGREQLARGPSSVSRGVLRARFAARSPPTEERHVAIATTVERVLRAERVQGAEASLVRVVRIAVNAAIGLGPSVRRGTVRPARLAHGRRLIVRRVRAAAHARPVAVFGRGRSGVVDQTVRRDATREGVRPSAKARVNHSAAIGRLARLEIARRVRSATVPRGLPTIVRHVPLGIVRHVMGVVRVVEAVLLGIVEISVPIVRRADPGEQAVALTVVPVARVEAEIAPGGARTVVRVASVANPADLGRVPTEASRRAIVRHRARVPRMRHDDRRRHQIPSGRCHRWTGGGW